MHARIALPLLLAATLAGCMAAGPPVASQTPPFWKQSASTIVSPQGARITFPLCLNVFARLAQNAGEWSASGPPDWYVAS